MPTLRGSSSEFQPATSSTTISNYQGRATIFNIMLEAYITISERKRTPTSANRSWHHRHGHQQERRWHHHEWHGWQYHQRQPQAQHQHWDWNVDFIDPSQLDENGMATSCGDNKINNHQRGLHLQEAQHRLGQDNKMEDIERESISTSFI